MARCVAVFASSVACFKPLQAWQLETGEVVFVERGSVLRALTLPCGQCIGCRLERSRQWAVRCVHESQMHAYNSFVTLTYREEELGNPSLVYRDFQLFAKRLRRKMGPFRFYMCGEYGEQYRRPHFHACLFGVFFADRVLFRRLPSGFDVYTSSVLESLWPHGFSSIGDVTFESAAYVARYIVKKVTGSRALDHYVSPDGEVLCPEFTRMSLKPGIGSTWFEKYSKEVYPRDYVVVRGMKCKPPRYYDELMREAKPVVMDFVDLDRYVKAGNVSEDTTPERLRVREQVAEARLRLKQRNLE